MTPAPAVPASNTSSPPLVLDPEALVHGLEDLRRGSEIQGLLISIGEPAVPALTHFLLRPPELHPQPRVLAAEALGTIGGRRAIRALLAALCRPLNPSLSQALALSEEAVQNAAARELGSIGDPATAGPLLYALRRAHLIEAGRALRRFHDTRAITVLVDCLNDPFIHERAAGILFEFGRDAVAPLIAALRERTERDGLEAPRSVERREGCARLLGALGDPQAEAVLRESLADPIREVRTAAAVALARVAPSVDLADRIPVLIEGLGDRLMADDCMEALLTRPGSALPALVDAMHAEAAQVDGLDARTPSRRLRAMMRTVARAGGDGGKRVLLRLAFDANPLLRGLALGHLARLDAPLSAPLVVECLRDPDARVRRTAIACARRIGLRLSRWWQVGGLLRFSLEELAGWLARYLHRRRYPSTAHPLGSRGGAVDRNRETSAHGLTGDVATGDDSECSRSSRERRSGGRRPRVAPPGA
jgi:HEAT repeat protein